MDERFFSFEWLSKQFMNKTSYTFVKYNIFAHIKNVCSFCYARKKKNPPSIDGKVFEFF